MGMKLTITKALSVLLLGLLLPACGALNSDHLLSVDMYGVSKTPEGAVGNRDPKFQSYQLLKVDIVSEDGTSTSNLFDGEAEKIFRIVDREQLIYSKKIDDLVGGSYGSILLTFDPEVAGGTSDDALQTFTMSNPVLTLSQSFAVEKAKNINVHIKINWANTLADEGMTEPAFEISMD